MAITKKEILAAVKKANRLYSLDLEVRYNKDKPEIFRKAEPRKSINPAGLSTPKLFYWLDAWLKGYSARFEEEQKIEHRPWLKKPEICALER